MTESGSFSKLLLAWYDLNKRPLPWRGSKDPYKIWISEIIFQQTRIGQGTSYYLRFISLFPDIQSLASAEEDQVLGAWQGLGYYSFLLNIKKLLNSRVWVNILHPALLRFATGRPKLPWMEMFTAFSAGCMLILPR
jgi:adenine-specific DNA glycosylase